MVRTYDRQLKEHMKGAEISCYSERNIPAASINMIVLGGVDNRDAEDCETRPVS
jgi:hypothetical protein